MNNILKRYLLLAIFLPIASLLQAKIITINGHVSDAKSGEALIGVAIEAKQANDRGVVTDYNGNFTLKVNRELPLVLNVSYVGYRSQEVDVYSIEDPISIELSEDLNILREVVVLGYTRIKRQNLTGAVTSVRAKDLSSTAASSFSEKIQGQASGLIVSGTSGNPGSSVFVRLRGTTSIIVKNLALNDTILNAAERVEPLKDFPKEGSGGSSDVGDVSWAVPLATFGTATNVPGTPGHSWQNVAVVGSSIGTKGTINAAKVFSLTAIELYTNPSLLKSAKNEFDKARGVDFKYESLLGDRKPALDYRKSK